VIKIVGAFENNDLNGDFCNHNKDAYNGDNDERTDAPVYERAQRLNPMGIETQKRHEGPRNKSP
jgi:hypothetical protein